jgi:predicted phosphodiesterase
MRYLVISDIHANLAALEAVLEDAGSFDKVWCLGDMVGYGPDPNECIERLLDLPHICVAGNHDWAAIGEVPLEDFNPDAQKACIWTKERLSPSSREYLKNLPISLIEGDFTLVHGSPRHPVWEYILHTAIAEPNFAHFETRFCLVGHTHVPLIFLRSGSSCEAFLPPQNHTLYLGEERLIINPGSVGQPRDGDPSASYAILDTERLIIQYHRINYPIEVTQERMAKEGLPLRLIVRLGYGW